MHVLVMVATVHQAVLILSRVNNRSASTIQYRRLGKPLTASEFAGCWRSMTLSVNTTSRWASILQPATVIFHFPRLTLKRLSACFMSMATRILVSSDLQAIGRRSFPSVSCDSFNVFYFQLGATIARTIINKYNRAIKNELESRNYFDELSTVPTREQLTLWEKEISKAEEQRTNRPAAMDVMAPCIPRGRFISYDIFIGLMSAQHQHWLRREWSC